MIPSWQCWLGISLTLVFSAFAHQTSCEKKSCAATSLLQTRRTVQSETLVLLDVHHAHDPIPQVQSTAIVGPRNLEIYNMRFMDPNNVGDANSAPGKWWAEISKAADVTAHAHVHIRDLQGWAPSGALMIVGGGGMLTDGPFMEEVFDLLEKHDGPVAYWGLGLNEHHAHQTSQSDMPPKVDMVKEVANKHQDKFFFSLRDYDPQQRWRWVPCASCMNPFFLEQSVLQAAWTSIAAKHAVTERVGVIKHVVAAGEHCGQHLPKWFGEGLVQEADVTDNGGSDMDRVLRFISSYDVIVTTSYHAVFWATLLGKKVVLCEAWSSKMFRLKHPPTVYSGDLAKDIAEAKRYPNALQEARDATVMFAQHIFAGLSTKETRIMYDSVRDASDD